MPGRTRRAYRFSEAVLLLLVALAALIGFLLAAVTLQFRQGEPLRASLPEALLFTVLLAASFVNGCRYCMAAHSGLGQAVGLSPDHVTALRSGASLSDPRLEALRTFTEAMVRDRGHVGRETAQAFLAAGFTAQALLDVIVGIAFKTMSNYTDNLFEPPLDEGLKRWQWTRPAVQ